MQRLELKSRVDAILATAVPKISIREACALAHVNHGSYLRWCKEVEAGGPKAAKQKGRRPKFTPTDAERNTLRWFRSWAESFALAVEYFVEYAHTGVSPLPSCPHPRPAQSPLVEGIAAEMRRGGRWDARLPKPLRALCALTDHERRMIRGEKAYNDGALSTRRLMVIKDWDAEGRIVEKLMWGGCGYCSDDVSPEQPYVAEGADGPRVNRQTLATSDVYSRKWLGLLCLSREGDAYTKVDQADHARSIVLECGLPFYWSFEKGPWCNDFIDGVKIESGWTDEPGRWGGLDALFKVCHEVKPQHKTIEGGLNYFQSRMKGRALSIGSRSSRGENERATKVVTAAQRGNVEALRLLWNMVDGADGFWKQMETINGRWMSREFLKGIGDGGAVPNELWESTHQYRPLPSGDAWRFLPIKECRVIIKQRISVTLKGYGTFDFACVDRGHLPLLDNGHRLFVAFHPDKPEDGAHLFNGDTRSHYNRDGFKFGEFIGIARHLPAVVMKDFTGTGDYSAQRRARQAVQSELRTAKANHGGVVRLSRRADGLGNSLAIASGAEPAKAPRPITGRKPARSLVDLMGNAESTAPAEADAWAAIS